MHHGEIIIVGLSADAEGIASRLRARGQMASAVPSLGLARVNHGALIVMDRDIADPVDCAHMVFDCGGHLVCLGELNADGVALESLETRAREKNVSFQTGFGFRHDPALAQVSAWIANDVLGDLQVIHCESYSQALHAGPDVRQLALAALILGDKLSGFQNTRSGGEQADRSTHSLCQLTTEGGPRAVLSQFSPHPIDSDRILIVGSNATVIWARESGGEQHLSLHPNHSDATETVVLEHGQRLDAIADELLNIRGDEVIDLLGIPGGFSGLLNCIGEASVHGEYVSMSATDTDYFIHPTSVVDGPVEIGKDTRVWHLSKLLGPLTIGEGCSLGQNVVVERHVEIGRNVKIQNNVSVYSGVILEDDVFCGPSMVFTNVGTPRSAYPRKGQYLETRVRQGASIGANATIVCGNTLGRYSFVGAGSVVTRDVPDYALVYGNPAKVRGWSCFCGERLPLNVDEDGCEEATCEHCGRSYARDGLHVRMLD